MDAATRFLVRQRAGNRCEYCLIHQAHYESALHIEHIVSKQHRGTDDLVNLALACNRCNLHKGPNLTGIDPDSGQIVPLLILAPIRGLITSSSKARGLLA
jgi:5-methylcytosine-specific restriction endonuclease McrA